MRFSALVAQAIGLIEARRRVTFRALQLEFDLSDDLLAALREELRFTEPRIVEHEDRGFEWVADGAVPSAVATATMESRARAESPEYRQVSVLFCDLVGSTALASTLDPEDLDAMLRDYHAVCADAIERFDGHLAQYLGDGVLAYFGFPHAHEDDAVRATHAALVIAADMAAPTAPARPRVRIGIHTGPVLVTDVGAGHRRETLALGATPNLAAKIQQRAEPGAVLVSDATAHLLTGRFELSAFGTHVIEGVAAPQTLYRVIATTHGSAFEAAVSRGLTPLVGREHEAGLLRERVARATEGFGQVVLISGEPGIGKSRLVQSAREVREVQHLEYRCSAHFQHTALYPVIAFLQQLLQFEHGEDPAARLERLGAFVRTTELPLSEAWPLLAALLSLPAPADHPLPGLPPAQLRQRTLQILLELHLSTAARQPLCIVWEDLHWADATSLELIGMLVDECATTRLLMLATCRPEFAAPWPARTNFATLALSRLRPEEVSAMVRRLAHDKSLPPEVTAQILLKTDGVPLFVEELTKMLLESDLLRETARDFELAGPLPPLAIPDTLQESLQARLDRLGSAREIAQIGAVLGREFAHDLLLAVAGVQPAVLESALQKLLGAELIYRRGRSPHQRYVFKHALIQDAAYQSLLKSRRQALHQRVAEILERQFQDVIIPQPQLLAHHLTEAGRLEQAIPVWQQAGQRAFERSANLEAIGHLRKGLALNASLIRDAAAATRELALLMTLAPAQMATAGYASDAVATTYARVRELTPLLADASARFPLLYGLWLYYANVPDYPSAYGLAEQLGSMGFDAGTPTQALLAHQACGVLAGWMGRFEMSDAHLAFVAEHYDATQHHRLTFEYGGLDPGTFGIVHRAVAQWFLGFPERALTSAESALALAQAVNHPVSLAHVLVVLGWVCLLCGDRDRARETLLRARSTAADNHADFWVGWADGFLGAATDDVARLEAGVTALEKTGVRMGQPMHLAFLAGLHLNRETPEFAADAVADAMDLAERGEKMTYAELHRLRGEIILVTAGDPREAETWFERAIDIAREQQAKSYELRATMSLARKWQREGRRREAHARLAEIFHWFSEGFETGDLIAARTLLSDLAAG